MKGMHALTGILNQSPGLVEIVNKGGTLLRNNQIVDGHSVGSPINIFYRQRKQDLPRFVKKAAPSGANEYELGIPSHLSVPAGEIFELIPDYSPGFFELFDISVQVMPVQYYKIIMPQ